jgi:hypothetical protein
LLTNEKCLSKNGYKNRMDYLKCMAEDYGVPVETVLMMASTMGKNEDFDGLIVMLEDLEELECLI